MKVEAGRGGETRKRTRRKEEERERCEVIEEYKK